MSMSPDQPSLTRTATRVARRLPIPIDEDARRAGESRRARTHAAVAGRVPTRWARPTTAPGRTSRSSPRSPSASSCACSTTTATETRVAAARGRRLRLARLPARRRPGPALRLPGARPVRPAHGPAVQPEQAAARPVRQGDRRRGRVGRGACSATSSTIPDERNDDDSAPHVPKSRRDQPVLRLGRRPPPRTPYHETVIYEAHVKGLTQPHPDIPEELRGTYAGLAHPAMIEHLHELGVTAVELMPVHQFVHDRRCSRRACATTGATTRSASSPRTTPTLQRGSSASRCRSSRRWCATCTTPASR